MNKTIDITRTTMQAEQKQDNIWKVVSLSNDYDASIAWLKDQTVPARLTYFEGGAIHAMNDLAMQ